MGRWDDFVAPFATAESDQPVPRRDYLQEEIRRREQAGRSDIAQYDIAHARELERPFETPLGVLGKISDPLGNIAAKGSELALKGTQFAPAAPFIGLAAAMATPGPGEMSEIIKLRRAAQEIKAGRAVAEASRAALSTKIAKLESQASKAKTVAEQEEILARSERLSDALERLKPEAPTRKALTEPGLPLRSETALTGGTPLKPGQITREQAEQLPMKPLRDLARQVSPGVPVTQPVRIAGIEAGEKIPPVDPKRMRRLSETLKREGDPEIHLLEYLPFPDPKAKPVTWLDAMANRSPDVIRSTEGLAGVPPGVAREVSEGLAKVRQDRAILLGDAIAPEKMARKQYLRLPPDAQRAIAQAMEERRLTGNPSLDAILTPFQQNRKVLQDVRIETGIGGAGETGYPHINPHAGEIMRLADGKPGAAEQYVRELWAKKRPGQQPPADNEIRAMIHGMKADAANAVDKAGRKTVFAPNLQKTREYNIPGWIGDPYAPDFSGRAFIEGLDAYANQWSFGVADARAFGPNAERFNGLVDQIDNTRVKDYVNKAREAFVGAQPGMVVESDANDWLSALKSATNAALLDAAFIPNAFEYPLKGPARAAKGQGFFRGYAAFARAAKDVATKGIAESEDYAREIGLIEEELTREIIGREATLGGTGGLASRVRGGAEKLQDVVLKRITPFAKTNQFWDTMTPALARVTLRMDYEDIMRATEKPGFFRSRRAVRAIRDIQDTLANYPEDAARLIADAKRGIGFDPESPNLKPITDRYAFEFARSIQPTADPLTVPIKFQTPLGRLWYIYRNWPVEYSRFIWRNGVQEAFKGNPGPLAAIVGGGVLTGRATQFALDVLRGRIRSDEEAQQYMEDRYNTSLDSLFKDFTMSGGFGMVSAAIRAGMGLSSGVPQKISSGYNFLLGAITGGPADVLVQAGSGPESFPVDLALEATERTVPFADIPIGRYRQMRKQEKLSAKISGPRGPRTEKPKGFLKIPLRPLVTDALMGLLSKRQSVAPESLSAPIGSRWEGFTESAPAAAAGAGRWDDF